MSDIADMLAAANAARANAHAPYSGFAVGSCLRGKSGRLYAGCNVENAAYPLGICAEKTAIGDAATAGIRPGDIEAIGITASPCGGCRQWLHEFRIDRVSYRAADGTIHTVTTAELLPDGWDLPE